MAIRPPRRRIPRNSSTQVAVPREIVDQLGPGADDQAEQRSEGHPGPDREAVVDKFEASLRTQSGLDEQERDFMVRHFRKAVAEAPLELDPAGPDRNVWIETLETLVQNGLLAEEERETLVRQFNEATSPLQSREVQVALEFAQRIQRDGDAKALEWLAAQQASPDGQAAAGISSPGATPIIKQAITRSRSRRLRGPPGRA